MTRTAVERGPETDEILAVLTAAELLVGDSVRPAGGGFPGDDTTTQFVPYAVLYQGVTTLIDGTAEDPNADTVNEYQLTSVGVTRQQASWVADKARPVLLQHTGWAVPARFVNIVEWTQGQPAQRDDDVTPPLFYVIDIYSITTTPA